MIDTMRLRILLVALSDWVNRHQHDVIDYLRQENRVLQEHLGGRRLRLTDAERRRLAATGHRLGRRTLTDVGLVRKVGSRLRRWTTATATVNPPVSAGLGSSWVLLLSHSGNARDEA